MNVTRVFAVLTVVGLLPFARFRFGPNTPCCKQHGESKRTEHEELRDRPRVRVIANGVGRALREFD